MIVSVNCGGCDGALAIFMARVYDWVCHRAFNRVPHMTQHDWRTYLALPGRSYDDCRREGCDAKAVGIDGKWTQTSGPKECEGESE